MEKMVFRKSQADEGFSRTVPRFQCRNGLRGLEQRGLQGGDLALSEDKTSLTVTTQGATGIWWPEHRTTPGTKNYLT